MTWWRTFLTWASGMHPEDAARMTVWKEMSRQNADTCDICSGRAIYVCPSCGERIDNHSHENDFICKRHGFVDPIRLSDGARIDGDGRCHPVWEKS